MLHFMEVFSNLEIDKPGNASLFSLSQSLLQAIHAAKFRISSLNNRN